MKTIQQIKRYLFPSDLMADPAVHTWQGATWIYPSHDRDTGIPEQDDGSHFDMVDYHALRFEGDPMTAPVEDCGVLFCLEDAPWAKRQLWDSDATEKDGRYYICFSAKDWTDTFRLGLAVADFPRGPFRPYTEPIAGSYFLIYNLQAEDKLPLFMALGTVPAFILMPCLPLIRKVVSKHSLFYWSLGLGAAGLIAMYVITKGLTGPLRLWGVMIAQVIKSAGILIATGYMWALVPEVISYGELRTGRRLARIINALTGIFYKAGMAIGGVIPAAVLAGVGFQAQATTQSSLAQEGILWVMTVIPAGLLILAAYIVSRYELTDEVMNEVNRALKNR